MTGFLWKNELHDERLVPRIHGVRVKIVFFLIAHVMRNIVAPNTTPND